MRRGIVDTLFANTDEILSLYETPSLDEALVGGQPRIPLAAVTRSEKGSVVVEGRHTYEVPAFPIVRLADTTGAGDLYAAGFLAGLARGVDLKACARLGALAAAEIIQHLGARPEASLALLAHDNGLRARAPQAAFAAVAPADEGVRHVKRRREARLSALRWRDRT